MCNECRSLELYKSTKPAVTNPIVLLECDGQTDHPITLKMDYIVAPCKSGNCVVTERCAAELVAVGGEVKVCSYVCVCAFLPCEGRGFLMVRQMSTKGPGSCSISSHLHSIILRLPASNKAREPCFLEAGHRNPRGPAAMPGWSLVEMCVSRDLRVRARRRFAARVYALARAPPPVQETPLIALSSQRALLRAAPTLSGEAVKRMTRRGFPLATLEKYGVNHSINHATAGSLSTSNRLLQHLPLRSLQ